jgi:hypothetical protein
LKDKRPARGQLERLVADFLSVHFDPALFNQANRLGGAGGKAGLLQHLIEEHRFAPCR